MTVQRPTSLQREQVFKFLDYMHKHEKRLVLLHSNTSGITVAESFSNNQYRNDLVMDRLSTWNGKDTIWTTLNRVRDDWKYKEPRLGVDGNPLTKVVNGEVKNIVVMGVKDEDISRITHILFDLDLKVKDPELGGAATEHAYKKPCRRAAKHLIEFLYVYGFPEPWINDSGNGIHVIYEVNLPNNQETHFVIRELLERCQILVDKGPEGEYVKLDPLADPGRKVKIAGILSIKGREDLHRYSYTLQEAPIGEIVSAETIKRATSHLPPLEKPISGVAPLALRDPSIGITGTTPQDMEALFLRDKWTIYAREEDTLGWHWFVKCKNEDEHSPPKALKDSRVTLHRATRAISYTCLHKGHCHAVDWNEMRVFHDPDKIPFTALATRRTQAEEVEEITFDKWLQKNVINYHENLEDNDAGLFKLTECLFDPSHSKAYIDHTWSKNSAPSYNCIACGQRSWDDVLRRVKRPVIISDRDNESVDLEAIDNLLEATLTDPKLFQKNGSLYYVSDGRLVKHSQGTIMTALARCSRFVTYKESKSGPTYTTVRTMRDLGAELIALPIRHSRIPVINSVVKFPIALESEDGIVKVYDAPGYCKETGFYYEPAIKIPRATPSKEKAYAAVEFLFNSIFKGTPILENDRASKAHLLAMILQPAVRRLIPDSTPLYAINADQKGSGKTKLAEAAMLIWGNIVGSMSVSNDPEKAIEFKKALTTRRKQNVMHLFFDNVMIALNSDYFASALTESTYEDRMLGGNDLFTSENLETWIMTGNNLRLTGSEGLAERSAFIHLHTMRENAEDYFAESDSVLPTIMVTKHREQVLEAIYAIVDYWVSLGCPKYQGNVSARLQSWLQVMGGLLESCGVHGVMGNFREDVDNNTDEKDSWTNFLNAWYWEVKSTPAFIEGLSSPELYKIAMGDPIGEGKDAINYGPLANYLSSRRTRGFDANSRIADFGQALYQVKNRVFSGMMLEKGKHPRTRKAVYFLRLMPNFKELPKPETYEDVEDIALSIVPCTPIKALKVSLDDDNTGT